MKKLLLACISGVFLNATEYYGKVEPYESYTISAEHSGVITYVNLAKEHSFLKKKTLVVKLDTQDEKTELHTLQNTLDLQKDIVQTREVNYKNKSHIKQLSAYDVNQEKLLYLDAALALEATRKDMKLLQNRIAKKEFFHSARYLSEIYVASGEYVNEGSKLFMLHDFSKSKIEIYVRENDVEKLRDKEIYLDDKSSKFAIEKISLVNDAQRVSTYKVVLYCTNNEKYDYFGQVVKVEFK